MAKLTITAGQELDILGDEFMDDREFEIIFDILKNSKYIKFEIPELGIENCFISKSDLQLLTQITTN